MNVAEDQRQCAKTLEHSMLGVLCAENMQLMMLSSTERVANAEQRDVQLAFMPRCAKGIHLYTAKRPTTYNFNSFFTVSGYAGRCRECVDCVVGECQAELRASSFGLAHCWTFFSVFSWQSQTRVVALALRLSARNPICKPCRRSTAWHRRHWCANTLAMPSPTSSCVDDG